jgi:hypothetical protein
MSSLAPALGAGALHSLQKPFDMAELAREGEG